MLTETTFDAFDSGSDSNLSGPIPAFPDGELAGTVGVAGCTSGHSGTRPAAVGV